MTIPYGYHHTAPFLSGTRWFKKPLGRCTAETHERSISDEDPARRAHGDVLRHLQRAAILTTWFIHPCASWSTRPAPPLPHRSWYLLLGEKQQLPAFQSVQEEVWLCREAVNLRVSHVRWPSCSSGLKEDPRLRVVEPIPLVVQETLQLMDQLETTHISELSPSKHFEYYHLRFPFFQFLGSSSNPSHFWQLSVNPPPWSHIWSCTHNVLC